MSGRLSESPADVIRQLLVDLATGAGTPYGTLPTDAGTWPIHVASRPENPDSLIVVLDTAGRSDGRLQISGEKQEHYGVQILVRDPIFPTGWTKSNEIAIALDEEVAYDNVAIGSNRYLVYSITRESGPFHLGNEEGTKRQMFSLNLTTALKQTV